MRFKKLVFIAVVLALSVLHTACHHKTDKTATVNLLINDAEMTSTSVTGKELLWSKSQIKWKDTTGSIQFKAKIQESDLLVIKSKNSYKYLICYLEEGQDLNIIYEAHQYKIIGNSIAARQNRLLIEISHIRKMLLSPQRNLPVKDEKICQKAYNDIEELISEFESTNDDASSQFIDFVRFDNKYAYMNSLLTDSIFKLDENLKATKQAQDIYDSVLDDSDYKNAYYSKYYRHFLKKTLGFIRHNDPEYKSNLTTSPVMNEWHLASMLKCSEMQSYQMAVSLKELFSIDCNLDIKHEINRYAGYWRKFLQEEYKSYVSREPIQHKLNKKLIKDQSLMMLSDDEKHIDLKDCQGNWIMLGIGQAESGYSQFEANYLDKINSRLTELNCFCFIEPNSYQSERVYNHINWVHNTNEQLKAYFNTDNLPSSILINPEGEVEMINLPRPSTGMLEPLLKKLMKSGIY